MVHLSVLGELAGGIAHQLSTPLQLISTNLHFLKRSWPSVEACLPANDNAGPASNDKAAPASNTNGGAGATDLLFIVEEVPKAVAQSLESLDEMALLLRTMKEWCAPQDGAIQLVDPAAVLRQVLLLTQHRWRYLFNVAQHTAVPLPELHCSPQELAAALTQLLLLVTHALADLGDGTHPTVDISCKGDTDHILFVVSWSGAPPDLPATDTVTQLASRLHGEFLIDLPPAECVTLRLRVPCNSAHAAQ